MNERAQLFETILANPDDDHPRLVFADWLEENGEPARAEFIRVQIEYARLKSWEPRRTGLVERATELLVESGSAWRLPFLESREQVFNRGFVDEVHLSASRFLESSEDIFRNTPLFTARLSDLQVQGTDLLESHALYLLRGIDLADDPWGDSIGLTWDDPEDHASRQLDFGFDPQMLLMEFPLLQSLKLTGYLCSAFWEGLSRDVFRFPKLRELHLRSPFFRTSTLEQLLLHPALSRLTSLAVSGSDNHPLWALWRAAGVRILTTRTQMSTLHNLRLSGQQIGDGGLRCLAEWPGLANVESLSLALNDMGSTGTTAIEVFAESPYTGKLRSLSLERNPLGDAGVRELLEWPGMAGLRYLALNDCMLSPAMIQRLDSLPAMFPGLWVVLR